MKLDLQTTDIAVLKSNVLQAGTVSYAEHISTARMEALLLYFNSILERQDWPRLADCLATLKLVDQEAAQSFMSAHNLVARFRKELPDARYLIDSFIELLGGISILGFPDIETHVPSTSIGILGHLRSQLDSTLGNEIPANILDRLNYFANLLIGIPDFERNMRQQMLTEDQILKLRVFVGEVIRDNNAFHMVSLLASCRIISPDDLYILGLDELRRQGYSMEQFEELCLRELPIFAIEMQQLRFLSYLRIALSESFSVDNDGLHFEDASKDDSEKLPDQLIY